MIKNYLKLAFRNAIKQKQFTFLNIFGLSIGIAVCMIIGLYVVDEMTYDTFHDKGDHIYRINQSNIWEDWNGKMSNTGPNVAIALKKDIPEFKEITRLLSVDPPTVSYRNDQGTLNSFREERYFAAEKNFFDVFSFDFYKGDPKTALNEPMSMIMTYETAERYFGNANDAIGKVVQVKDENRGWINYTVKAILANVPRKSHLQFDILVSLNSFQADLDRSDWMWIWTGFSTYGLVDENTNMERLTAKLQNIPPKWAPPTAKRVFNQSYDEFTSGRPWKLYLQPLAEVYLSKGPKSHLFGPTGNRRSVSIFAVIGLLVLLLSAINFMNLATAQSTKRAKEVGVQKALGSGKKILITRFIVESMLFVSISTIIALGLAFASLDTFEKIAGKELDFASYIMNPFSVIILITFILALGILSGSYPAFYIAAFKPVEVLKGKIDSGFKGKGIRNSLVVFQFMITVILIVCSFFVQKQLNYATSYDLGFTKKNLLHIHHIEQLDSQKDVFKAKLKSLPAINSIGESFDLPPYIGFGGQFKASEKPEAPVIKLNNMRAEGDYVNTLGLEFIDGRNFNNENKSDKYKVILNEEAVKMLGWGGKESFIEDSPVGKFLALISGEHTNFEVIGVVKNFHFNTVKQKIAPLVIFHYQNDKFWNYKVGKSSYALRLNPTLIKDQKQLQTLIKTIQSELTEINPSVPYEYSFLDQEYEKTFRSEQQMSSVLNVFTILALLIACLGLIGLAAFSAEKRRKEIGVRKVLGQSKSQISILLSVEFTKLVGIAAFIGLPIAFFISQNWLSSFAYSIELKLWYFIAAGIITLLVAFATVSVQTIRAANKNPIDSLQEE